MASVQEHIARFANYPGPREAPEVPWGPEAAKNPIIRGAPLSLAMHLVRASSLITGILWRNNKFHELTSITEISTYSPRSEPTVTPIRSAQPNDVEAKTSPADLPTVQPRKSTNHHYTCADYHAAYLSGKLTPRDVVDAILPLVSRDSTPQGVHHRAFTAIRVELVRKAADASTERYKQGKPLSVLDGVPFCAKDEAEVDGYPRTIGSPLDMHDKVEGTEWSIRKLEEAGGIVLGKSVMHEFGMDVNGINPHWGTPHNPHNHNYFTGGSSSGTGYAVSSGIVPIGHGSDAAGSIRIPSGFCGVYGLKTTHGRLSRLPTVEVLVSECVTGPLASSIDDLAIAYRIMAVPDPSHDSSRDFPHPSLTIPQSLPLPNERHIGVPETWIKHASLSPEVATLFNSAISHLTNNASYILHPISIPLLQQGQKAQAFCCLTQGSSVFGTPSHPPSQLRSLTPQTELLFTLPLRHATLPTLVAANRLRNLLMQHLSHLFTVYPGLIILTPTAPCAGWPIAAASDVSPTNKTGFLNSDMSLRAMTFSWLANFTGLPCLNVPIGYVDPAPDANKVDPEDRRKIPVGMIGMGEWGSEEALISWARVAEGILGQEGVRRPEVLEGKEERGWVDVLGLAAKAKAQNGGETNGAVENGK